jgi:hypothetical protein
MESVTKLIAAISIFTIAFIAWGIAAYRARISNPVRDPLKDGILAFTVVGTVGIIILYVLSKLGLYPLN